MTSSHVYVCCATVHTPTHASKAIEVLLKPRSLHNTWVGKIYAHFLINPTSQCIRTVINNPLILYLRPNISVKSECLLFFRAIRWKKISFTYCVFHKTFPTENVVFNFRAYVTLTTNFLLPILRSWNLLTRRRTLDAVRKFYRKIYIFYHNTKALQFVQVLFVDSVRKKDGERGTQKKNPLNFLPLHTYFKQLISMPSLKMTDFSLQSFCKCSGNFFSFFICIFWCFRLNNFYTG